MGNKLYRGIRQGHEAKVFVDNVELSFEPSKKLRPSNATWEFGYFGDGPSATALAILFDATQDTPNASENALKYYHDFKFEFIATAPYELGFTILQSQVIEWLNKRLEIGKNDPGGWVI